MQINLVVVVFVLACVLNEVQSRLAGECAMECNDLRTEVLTMDICR